MISTRKGYAPAEIPVRGPNNSICTHHPQVWILQ